MRITTPAGELDVVVGDTSAEGGSIVINARVGIWEVKVYIGPGDFKFFLRTFFNPKVLILLLKRLLRKAKQPPPDH